MGYITCPLCGETLYEVTALEMFHHLCKHIKALQEDITELRGSEQKEPEED